MGDHDAPFGVRCADRIGQDAGNIFVGQAVESVAPNAVVGETARQREGGSDLRLGVVKGGVEAGDLRQRRMEFCIAAMAARLCG